MLDRKKAFLQFCNRYLIVGAINTFLTYVIFMLAFLYMPPGQAYIIAALTVTGLNVILHKKITTKDSSISKRSYIIFSAYVVANLIFYLIVEETIAAGFNPTISFLFAVIGYQMCYAPSMYIINNYRR